MQNARERVWALHELQVSIPAPLKYAAKLLSLLSKCHPQPDGLLVHTCLDMRVAFLPLLPRLVALEACSGVHRYRKSPLNNWNPGGVVGLAPLGWMDSVDVFFLVLSIVHHRQDGHPSVAFMEKTIPVEPVVRYFQQHLLTSSRQQYCVVWNV